MKKIALIIALAGLALTASAQLRLDNAKNYANPKKGYYDKAKIEIDAACEEEGTKNNPEVWAWKGWIYVNLGMSDKPKIKKVCPENWADIAYEAALKSKELNVAKEASIITLNNEVFKFVAEKYVNEAYQAYNNAGDDTNQYRKCINSVSKAINIFQASGASNDDEIKDRVKEARFIAGAAARALGDNKAVVKFYKPLVKAGYDKVYVYQSLAAIYENDKDTVEAMKLAKTYTEKQSKDYNAFLLAAKVSSWAGNAEMARNYANSAIEKASNLQDPAQKAGLMCSVADVYVDILDYDAATKEFEKVLEVTPNNPVAYNGLGRLHFNKGTDIDREADNIPLEETEKYEELHGKALKEYEEAAKYYKKSLDTNDKSSREYVQRYNEALRSIQMVYARMKKPLDELKVYEQ